mmetsp:Transcript_35787/g.77864  ORF Transcript_35787/g.77864 Transcript_35787/m.77864 type:complete len:332 (+) Transcript_35787:60-1055(+)
MYKVRGEETSLNTHKLYLGRALGLDFILVHRNLVPRHKFLDLLVLVHSHRPYHSPTAAVARDRQGHRLSHKALAFLLGHVRLPVSVDKGVDVNGARSSYGKGHVHQGSPQWNHKDLSFLLLVPTGDNHTSVHPRLVAISNLLHDIRCRLDRAALIAQLDGMLVQVEVGVARDRLRVSSASRSAQVNLVAHFRYFVSDLVRDVVPAARPRVRTENDTAVVSTRYDRCPCQDLLHLRWSLHLSFPSRPNSRPRVKPPKRGINRKPARRTLHPSCSSFSLPLPLSSPSPCSFVVSLLSTPIDRSIVRSFVFPRPPFVKTFHRGIDRKPLRSPSV